MIQDGLMDEKYKLVTFGLDGTHCPIWKKYYEKITKFHSYKNKDSAYNVLAMMLTNGFWCYVGQPVPAGSTNDLGSINKNINFKK